jgi:hypothetical protein
MGSAVAFAFVFRRHPERSEGPPHLLFVFAVAVVLALAFLASSPKGISCSFSPLSVDATLAYGQDDAR